MPRIKLSSPTAEAIRRQPRAYSLYQQCQPQDDGVSSERLSNVVRDFGDAKSSSKELPDNLSFEELAARLHRGTTHEAPEGHTGNCLGFAARDESGLLAPYRFQRRQLGPDDVRIQVAYCGVCHSDLHTIKGEWGKPSYPICPGHEIVGIISEVGSNVRPDHFAVGQPAAVGCMVNSCGKCDECKEGLEQYCNPGGPVWTYNSKDKDGTITQGGYTTHVVVDRRFAVRFPGNLPMGAGAPLLCAGITTYSPMRHFGLDKPGMKLGVVGLGGLGHMAVKFGKAFGMEVTVISTSPNKREDAMGRLKADHFVVSRNADEMMAAAGTLHGIIDTVSAQHNLADYLPLLRTDGKLVIVGLPPEDLTLKAVNLTARRKLVAGSTIGGIKETQEMLDFCGEHGIVCDVEMIKVDDINTAMERLLKNDVKWRFVIDIQGSLVLDPADISTDVGANGTANGAANGVA